MRCFVPNCENTIGIPFPEDYDLQNIWLKNLQISNEIPNVNSFVCFDHFSKDDVEESVHEDGSIEKRILPGAVPRLFALEDVIEKETEEFLEFRHQKIVPQTSTELPDISESTEQGVIEQSSEVVETEAEPNTVDGTEQPEFVPQFQEYQDGFILEPQEFSESHSSSQSFPAYAEDAEGVQNQEQDVSQESNLVIQENQDFLTVQHEFEPQQVFTTEGEVFTSEGQPVHIFSSQGQPVFTAAGQQVFVSEGQPLLTQEGHQIFISEEQQNTSTEDQSFENENTYVENVQTEDQSGGSQVQEIFEGEMDQHEALDQKQLIAGQEEPHLDQQPMVLDQEESQQMILDHQESHMDQQEMVLNKQETDLDQHEMVSQQHQIVSEEQESGLDQQMVMDDQQPVVEHEGDGEYIAEEAMIQDASNEMEPTEFQDHQESQSEDQFIEHKTIIHTEPMPQEYPETVEQPLHPTDQQHQHQTFESSTPAENIVMQWFVPNQPTVKTEPNMEIQDQDCAQEDQNRIMITYQQEAAIPQTQVVQQRVVISKGQGGSFRREVVTAHPKQVVGKSQVVSPVKMVKRDRVVEQDKFSEDHCRLCKSRDNVNVNILDNIKDNIMVLEAVQLCVHPLEISLEDPFSKKICIRCFNLIQKYFEFRQCCLKVDAEQKRAYEKEHPRHRFLEKRKITPPHGIGHSKKTHMKTIISPSKTGYRQTEIVTVMGPNPKNLGMKNVARKVVLTPTSKKKTSEEIQYLLKDVNTEVGPNEKCVRQIISKVSKADDIQVYKLKKSSQSNHNGQSYTTKYTTVQKNPATPITISPHKLKPSQIEALARKQPPLSTAKQIKLQEELKKVIEGTMSKDDLSVDHVIVRVVSDDETEDHFPAKRKKFNSPVSVEPKHEFSKMKVGRNEVLIPKGIRVTVPERFESSKGTFPCFPKVGAFGTEFILIDGYLFEYRLCKGKERFMKCITLSCPATACQKLLPTGKFENRAHVRTPHNHPQLTGTEIKKQMFYFVMKKKMQADKGLNFRSIYDQICEKDPEIRYLVPLRNLINEICKHQTQQRLPQIKSFDDFYNVIEEDGFHKYQFTYSGKQFYQERFTVKEDGTKAVIFANADTIKRVSHSKLMYVDASFRIDTGEGFSYQLVTVLVWIDDSYYPIMFALVSNRTMEIFKKVFSYLHDTLAPNLCPEEIVTDYEANIYYALGETYLESHIGGSVFYYTQNLYKKICELGLSRELETTSYFRNVYHMLLMLPLLPVNTIMDGLQNIEIQANDLAVGESIAGLFEHIKEQWMEKVTPDLFCVHRLENRINENVIAPFKKLRDFLMLSKGKTQRQTMSIMSVVEKLIDLENFLQTTYSSENKKSFGRDLSSSQKKNVLKAWQYIETHPKININHFFTKVIGYIKCMENQLWIWGYYKFSGKVTDDLINASNFSIVNTNQSELETVEGEETVTEEEPNFVYTEDSENTVVVEAVVGPSGEFVVSNLENNQSVDNSILKYVYKE